MDTNQHESGSKRRFCVRWVRVVVTLAVGAGLFGGYCHWEKLRLERILAAESCPGCRFFVHHYFQQYADSNDGWYPRGGATALDSLGKLVSDDHPLRHFTSHALVGDLQEHWKLHRTLAPEFTCYRYNEGLRIDDPDGFILLYFHRPTAYQSRLPHAKMNYLGRPVLVTPPGWSWEFFSEAEFQKRQSNTLAYIEQKGRLKKPN